VPFSQQFWGLRDEKTSFHESGELISRDAHGTRVQK